MNPPLLCCVLSHWDTFQDLRMVEKCWPRDVHGIFAISWVINPDQQHLSSLWLRKMSLVISKNVKKPLPWKCLGCLSSWPKFSPFNGLTHTHTCALWLKECKHPSSPWAEKELGLYSGGFFHFYFFFFSLFLTERTLKYSCGESVLVCVATLSLVTLWEVMLCQRQRWKNALHFSGLCLMKVEWFSLTPVKKTTTKY